VASIDMMGYVMDVCVYWNAVALRDVSFRLNVRVCGNASIQRSLYAVDTTLRRLFASLV
jgi:hypothetical protein